MTSNHTYAATTSGISRLRRRSSSPPRTNRHQADTTSLTPANIHVDVHSKQPYPWELVPQLKARPGTGSAGRESSAPSGEVEKENRIPQSNSAQQTHAKTTREPINLVTPPRAPGKLRQKSPSPSTPLGARTPHGSQRDPSCPPVRGQCWGIKQDGTRCTRKVRTPSHTNKLAPAGTPNERSRYERGASAPPMLHQGASAGQPLFVIGDSGSEDELGTAVARRQRLASPASKDAADDIDEVYCFQQHVAEVNKTTGFYLAQGPPRMTLSSSRLVRHRRAKRACSGAVAKSDEPTAHDFDRAEQGTSISTSCATVRAPRICASRSDVPSMCSAVWASGAHDATPRIRFCALFIRLLTTRDAVGADAVEAPGVVLSHRWETLVHLELDAVGQRVLEVCHDCGTRHREIFMIPPRPACSTAKSSRRL